MERYVLAKSTDIKNSELKTQTIFYLYYFVYSAFGPADTLVFLEHVGDHIYVPQVCLLPLFDMPFGACSFKNVFLAWFRVQS